MERSKHERRFLEERERMVERQLKSRGIKNARVLSAFLKIPREVFVPRDLQNKAYEDHPLAIGYEQTISQPYIVALMTESLELESGDRVLEVGTGSGYQTAILAELSGEVYSVEIIAAFYEAAQMRLQGLGFQDVHLKHGDGCQGWPEAQPFDKVIVTAGAEDIPPALVEQLKEGGRIVIPLGFGEQDLVLGKKEKGVLVTKQLIPVRFVPLQTNVF